MGGVIGDSVHHVAYARHVANVLFYVEMVVKGAGGGGGLPDVWGVTSRALMMLESIGDGTISHSDHHRMPLFLAKAP